MILVVSIDPAIPNGVGFRGVRLSDGPGRCTNTAIRAHSSTPAAIPPSDTFDCDLQTGHPGPCGVYAVRHRDPRQMFVLWGTPWRNT